MVAQSAEHPASSLGLARDAGEHVAGRFGVRVPASPHGMGSSSASGTVRVAAAPFLPPTGKVKAAVARRERIHKDQNCQCGSCRGARWQEIRKRNYTLRFLINGRWIAPRPFEEHGSDSTYSTHGCRCLLCYKAHSVRMAAYREANRKSRSRKAS